MGVSRQVRRISPSAWFYCKCLRYKFYNGAPEIGLIRHLVARGKLALDVGCSIGIYAREMAKYATNVVAFEANPSVAAFVEMIRDPVYREAVKHRQAGVEDSRLIRHAVLPVGKTFGEIPK